jgi:NADP-dependent 3-hydroxy acid dehydrogenase YdfG
LAGLKRDEWKKMFDVNVHGVLNGIAAVLPRFVRQESGHVVNVASIAAHMVMPTAAVYCASKFAVWAITDGLRQEHDDIRATVISPGVVATELGHDISDPEVASALQEWRKKSLAPDAIARAIRFALEQPAGVDINEVIVRPTAAGM